MHLFSTATVGLVASFLAGSAVAAPSGCATAPIEGPFYITVVQANGTEYPTSVGVVSRGVEILSSALAYGEQFTYDTATDRVLQNEKPTMGSGEIGTGLPFIFTGDTGDWPLAQVEKDCAVYLVKAGTEADGVYSWWSEPTTGLPKEVDYKGSGSAKANAALRIDTEIPSERRRKNVVRHAGKTWYV